MSLLEHSPDKLQKFATAVDRWNRLDEMDLLEASLIDFIEAAWPWIDSAEYQRSWAVDAICEHLQAVTDGHIRKLLINVPPRCTKTTLCSIMWPAWTWARQQKSFLSGPGVRFLCGSYGSSLSLVNATAQRRLVLSPWYQERWGPRYSLRDDQNTKGKYDTSAGGTRISTSVGGSLLGIGYDISVVDDPHNLQEAESDADRETVRNWWREISSTRMNDPKQSALVVVMQRLHEEDISGVIMQGDDSDEWEHLMIPMRYDDSRHCVTSLWQDPRGESGETLMWPERFGEREVAALERNLGPYFASGRLQQMPTPDKGGIFDRTWWQLYESADGKFPPLDFVVASLDGAFTEKEENDPSAMTVWGCYVKEGQRRIILLNAWRKHLKFSSARVEQGPRESPEAYRRRTQHDWGLVEWIEDTCKRFKADKLLIESAGPGISAAQTLQERYGHQPWGIQLVPVRGDKVARALAVQPTFSQLMVYAPIRDWSQMVIDEMALFPKYKYDDLTDSATQAMSYLRLNGYAQTPAEACRAEREAVMHRPQPKAIYPV